MATFCETCENLLSAKYINDELTFNCESCHISYKSKDEDTLRKERVKENDVMIYEKILNKAVDDPATIKARIKCLDKKCKNDIVKQVRINDDSASLYNICITCKKTWPSN